MEQQRLAPFRVLSIDGGGIRGLYAAVLLQGIAERVARSNGRPEERLDVGSAFNLIVGTSTGAILSTALAAGVVLEDVIALYRNKASAIFQKPVPQATWPLVRWIFFHLRSAANSPDALREALGEVFRAETIEQMYRRRGIALCIPTVNVESQKAWVYKTPHDPTAANRLQRDNHYSLVDVCMSSAAAPIVLPVHGVSKPRDAAGQVNWFADGGLWANNPVLVGLVEALTIAPAEAPIHVVSVSTCPPFKAPSLNKETANRGLLGWYGGIRMLETAIDAQSWAYHYMAKTITAQFGDRVKYIRLTDPQISSADAPELRLDNPSERCLQALVRLGNEAVDLNMSEATTADKPKALLTEIFQNLPTLP